MENRGGLQLFKPFKREGDEKNDRKRGRVTKKKNTACILCFTRIQTTYENHDMRLFPDTQFNLH